MGGALGWRTVIVDDEGGSGSDHSAADRVVSTLDLREAGVNAGSYVVVATQGHYDEDAIEKALATEAAYVGLVASRKRAAAVLDYLKDAGISEDALQRVHAPAGLDLGKVRHEEIAVGVIGEIVKLKAAGELGSPASRSASSESASKPLSEHPAADGHEHHEHNAHPNGEAAQVSPEAGTASSSDQPAGAPVDEPEEAIDPVCGMTVTVAGARYHSEFEGKTYYFCRKAFETAPQDYVQTHASSGSTGA
jgi:xanthine dehydrogenase accessory factor